MKFYSILGENSIFLLVIDENGNYDSSLHQSVHQIFYAGSNPGCGPGTGMGVFGSQEA